MKLIDFPKAKKLSNTSSMIVDVPSEDTSYVYKIKPENALMSSISELSKMSHKMIYRGKNLGSELTTDQKFEIQNGSFRDLYIGDYWEINGVKYVIVDFDYWYETTKTHHLTMTTMDPLSNYRYGQDYIFPDTVDKIRNAFGATRIIDERTHEVDEVTKVSNIMLHPSTDLASVTNNNMEFTLMSPAMIFGDIVYHTKNSTQNYYQKYEDHKLAIMDLMPGVLLKDDIWLRKGSRIIGGRLYGNDVKGLFDKTMSVTSETRYGCKVIFALG